MQIWRPSPKICRWQAGDPGERLRQFQSKLCSLRLIKAGKDHCPSLIGRSSIVLRRVSLFVQFRPSVDCRRATDLREEAFTQSAESSVNSFRDGDAPIMMVAHISGCPVARQAGTHSNAHTGWSPSPRWPSAVWRCLSQLGGAWRSLLPVSSGQVNQGCSEQPTAQSVAPTAKNRPAKMSVVPRIKFLFVLTLSHLFKDKNVII